MGPCAPCCPTRPAHTFCQHSRMPCTCCRSEFRRVGIFNTPQLGTPVLDSFRIFSHFEQRNLASALRFFCGRDLCGAHGALADAQAAQDVLLAEVGGLVVAAEACRTASACRHACAPRTHNSMLHRHASCISLHAA